LYHWNFSVT